MLFVSGGDFVGLVHKDAEVLGSAGNDDLGKAKFSGNGQPIGATGAKNAPHSISNFAETVVEDGIDNSFLHHLLHCVATCSDGVEGDDFIAGFFKKFDGVHRALGEDAEIRHANDSFGLAFGDALLGLSHAPGGRGSVGEDLAGKDVEAEDIGDREHHRDVLDSDERRGVAGSGG